MLNITDVIDPRIHSHARQIQLFYKFGLIYPGYDKIDL